jgi:type II secretory pathway pseudopilin PulG
VRALFDERSEVSSIRRPSPRPSPGLPGEGEIRAGFTFVEVLFAVILLGIGFIMIAGIFPTAIQQTAVVSDETEGSLICRGALRRIQEVAETRGNTSSNGSYLFQPTAVAFGPSVEVPQICGFSPNLTNAIGADAFFTGDRQYAWVGFYRRDSATDPMAHVYVIAMKNPNFANYITHFAPGDTIPLTGVYQPPAVAPPIPPTSFNYAYVTPLPAANLPTAPSTLNQATLGFDPNGFPTVTITAGISTANFTTGAYLIVAKDNISSLAGTLPTSPYPSAMVGRILRLGAEVTSSTDSGKNNRVFQLQTGSDFSQQDIIYLDIVRNSVGNPTPSVSVFIMGRAPVIPPGGTEPVGYFTGPNQDIAVMSGWVHVNTSTN